MSQTGYKLWRFFRLDVKTIFLFILYQAIFPVGEQTFFGKKVSKNNNVQVTIENQHEVLLNKITPYHNKPYKIELQEKQEQAQKIVDSIRDSLKISGTNVTDISVESIIPSPQIDGYRNKDDFTVFRGADGSNATVGYLAGSPAYPGCCAVRPERLPHVKESHKRIAQLFEDYVSKSPLGVTYQIGDGGVWNRLVVRSTYAGDLMAVVITRPLSLELLAQERQRLVDHFIKHEPGLILYHQQCNKVDCTTDLSSYEQLAGKTPYLVETMGTKKFRISPHSFFQVNKKAAELLVNSIWDNIETTNKTTFLDLFCGVGMYSIMGSERVNKAVGVELLKGAVADAKVNADINNVTNCVFVAGRVEDTLSQLLTKTLAPSSYNNHLMALMNPGRAGSTKRVMSMIRRDKRIKKMVYVSCKPDNPHAMNNFIQLCRRDGRLPGEPFHLRRVRLFDLFPRTAHSEMVLEFDRSI